MLFQGLISTLDYNFLIEAYAQISKFCFNK